MYYISCFVDNFSCIYIECVIALLRSVHDYLLASTAFQCLFVSSIDNSQPPLTVNSQYGFHEFTSDYKTNKPLPVLLKHDESGSLNNLAPLMLQIYVTGKERTNCRASVLGFPHCSLVCTNKT